MVKTIGDTPITSIPLLIKLMFGNTLLLLLLLF